MFYTKMAFHVQLIGYLLLFLSLIHIVFPMYFQWSRELKVLSLVNRQIMYVHTFFIAFTVMLMGILCVSCTDALIHTPLGHTFSFGLGIFWGVRLLFQFFVYSPKLWRGKRFETFIHLVFIGLWSYLTFIFLYVSSIGK